MNIQNHQYILITLFLLIIIYFIIKIFNKNTNVIDYKLKPFLSENEKMCLQHLHRIFPEYYIYPQVSMGALLEPNIDRNNYKKGQSNYNSLWNSIKSNRIDFLIVNKQFIPQFIIELDDNSHNNKVEQDAKRDKNFKDVGIPTARFRNIKGKFPDRDTIEQKLRS